MNEPIFLGCTTPEQDDRLVESIRKVREAQNSDLQPITLEWLHSIDWLQTPWPQGWKNRTRGIEYANWTIHSIQSRPMNVPVEAWNEQRGYDAGPFVWAVAPTHGANMMPLERPGNSNFTILVLRDRRDVMLLLELLGRS